MIEIAKNDSSQGIYQKDIAVNQSLSFKYLDHIISALKTARLIANAKGKKSGYVLTRKPSEITIFDIHSAFEPGICLVECLSGNYQCERKEKCEAAGFWDHLNNMIISSLTSVTLEDLLNNKIRIKGISLAK